MASSSKTNSDLRDETYRPTAFLREHKLLIIAYRAGMYALDGQLNNCMRSTQATVARLFGDNKAEEKERAERMRTEMFPAFSALEKSPNFNTEAVGGVGSTIDERITVALKSDVSAMFVRVRAIADEAIPTLRDFVFDNPMPEAKRPKLSADTKRCTDYFDRHRAARKEMDELEKLCDDILWFTQLAAKHKFDVPADMAR